MTTFVKKLLAVAVLAAQVSLVNSASIGSPTSFNGLTWSFTTDVQGLTACTRLVLDATGDATRSSALAIHGFTNCASSNNSFAVTGTVYPLANGTYALTMYVGAGTVYTCVLSGNFSGQCTAFNGVGTVIGSGSMFLV